LKPQTFLFIILIIVVLAGLILPNGIRGAVANNIWSVRFVKQAYVEDDLDPARFSPAESHKHAGLLLANQALKRRDVEGALYYMAPMRGSAEPLVRHTIANLHFLQGEVAPAVEIWKDLGKFHTLEQAYRQLEGDDKIMALRAAFSLRPDIYAKSLVNALLSKANILLDEGNYQDAVTIYQQVIEQFPETINAYLYLARAYNLNGQQDLALKSIQEGWELAGQDISYYLATARIFEEMTIPDLALYAYQAALAIDPESEAALQGIQNLQGVDE
jgi:tetratricopeptide (TPR) repeat protein